ncbi:MAG: heme ABC transporter permease CcmB [Dehalococcoidales bacterium]|jgi:heme exporter protein B|nr:heme ABC transporter permease CcmB [Dehalococcoidales bacterium]|tara:strand:- start:771 stop:1442 length:672 start_codon:yes stop_codon:yes gene_type:complete
MRFLSKAIAIAWKDVLSETRTKETVSSVLVFALLVIVIFNFAFSANQETMNLVAPGILWVTFAFAGVLSLNRAFIMERDESCLEGLMACPVSRETIYVGKLMGSLLFMLVVEAVTLPIFALLFNIAVLSPQLIAITFLTTVGFAAVGTLFSAMAVNTRAREMVLPILFLPIVTPIIISAVNASELALSSKDWGSLASWLQIIVAFDVIFLVVSYLIFAFVIEE